MNLVYLGSGEFGLPSLNAIARSQHKLSLVVTQPAKPAGRGRITTHTAVAQWAAQNNIECHETENISSKETTELIAAHNPDLIVVISFGQKISNELIAMPPKGMINVHGSLVPKYRGAAPINWPIINGDAITGISVITVVEKMDAGDVLATATTPINTDDTAEDLYHRLSVVAAPVLIDTIDKIAAGTAVYKPQDHSEATKAPKLNKELGNIDFSEPAQLLQRKIRGLWPWPGATAVYTSKETGRATPVTIQMAYVVPSVNPQNLAPGTFDSDLNVICGRDALRITKIKPAGKPVMDFKDFANGRATKPGDTFSKVQ